MRIATAVYQNSGTNITLAVVLIVWLDLQLSVTSRNRDTWESHINPYLSLYEKKKEI